MSYWILSLFPDMDSQPIRPHYEMQWWSDNEVHLDAWKKGIKTLYYTRTESVLRGDIAEQAMDDSGLSCDG